MHCVVGIPTQSLTRFRYLFAVWEKNLKNVYPLVLFRFSPPSPLALQFLLLRRVEPLYRDV